MLLQQFYIILFFNDWCECVGEYARHDDIFLVHLSLGNKVVLYCIVSYHVNISLQWEVRKIQMIVVLKWTGQQRAGRVKLGWRDNDEANIKTENGLTKTPS